MDQYVAIMRSIARQIAQDRRRRPQTVTMVSNTTDGQRRFPVRMVR